MLIADYDLCSVSSSFFSHSQLTFVLSFSSSFIHTKAWWHQLSLSGPPNSSLCLCQIILCNGPPVSAEDWLLECPWIPKTTDAQVPYSQPSRLRISICWGPTVFFRPVIKLKIFSLESSFLPQFYSKLLFQQCLYCGTYLPSQGQYDGPKSQNDSVMNPRSFANALIWFSYSHPWNRYQSIYLQRLLRSYMYQWRLCLTTSNKQWLKTKEIICFK